MHLLELDRGWANFLTGGPSRVLKREPEVVGQLNREPTAGVPAAFRTTLPALQQPSTNNSLSRFSLDQIEQVVMCEKKC